MHDAEYPPPAALAAVVDCFWILEGEGTGVPEPIIPDGRIEIVLHYGVRFEQHHPGGRIDRQPASMIVGQMLAPICIGHRGRAGVAAIRLRPAAARAVVRCSAAEITGRVVDLEDLFGSTGSLRERLALAAGDRSRVALLERWLGAIVRGLPSLEIDAAVEAIAAASGAIDLRALAPRTGLSLRQLERRFQMDVGVAPKAFARTVRLQAALRRITGGEPLADVAIACGYYDQPHMTRDFGRLAETSPAAWQHYCGSLTPLFVGR
ncbi:MAG TPA: helix-turn-helix domain-containing protein [Vicinamibacterales bacterium]|nr:helix-turn-helix domain-containing protein [Vicinamibacterales bacterium]